MPRMTYFLSLFLLVFSPISFADWVMKQEIKTDIQGQPPPGAAEMPGLGSGTQHHTFYTRPDAVRIEHGDGQVVIIRLRGKQMSAYMVNTKERTYSDANQMLPMIAMGAMFFVECNEQGGCKERPNLVTSAGNETRVISGFKTRKAQMNVPADMMMGSGTKPIVWMTKDSKALAAEERARMTLFARGLASTGMPVNNMPELVQSSYDKIAAKFGVPVETVMDMGMMKSTTRIVSIEEKQLGNELFEVPKGYKETPAFSIAPGMPPMNK